MQKCKTQIEEEKYESCEYREISFSRSVKVYLNRFENLTDLFVDEIHFYIDLSRLLNVATPPGMHTCSVLRHVWCYGTTRASWALLTVTMRIQRPLQQTVVLSCDVCRSVISGRYQHHHYYCQFPASRYFLFCWNFRVLRCHFFVLEKLQHKFYYCISVFVAWTVMRPRQNMHGSIPCCFFVESEAERSQFYASSGPPHQPGWGRRLGSFLLARYWLRWDFTAFF